MKGLLTDRPTMPVAYGTGADDQPALAAEEALKKRREKLASDKLGIPPETDSSV